MRSKDKIKKRNGFKKFIITLLILILIIPLGVIAYGYCLLESVSTGEKKERKVSINKPVNVLLLGLDAGDYDDKSGNSPKRSDTIMLARYNPSENKIYILSIPRDTRITENGHGWKINALHREGGTALLIKKLEEMLGVKVDYYAKVDYEGFRNCIDAIGGVDVTIPFNMDYDAYDISIHFNEGETYHLDGEKAEAFVRWRKNNDGGGYAMGDLGRINTQQQFLLKVFEKMKTPSGIVKIPDLLKTASKYISTDMDPNTILLYMIKLRKMETKNIETLIIPGEPKYINGVSYYIYDKLKDNDYVLKFKDSDDDSQVLSEKFNRDEISVTILNSTGVNGLAASYRDKLMELGYKDIKTGNYETKLDETLIKDYSKEGYGELIKNDIKIGDLVKKSTEEAPRDIVVILGMDVVKYK